MALSSCKWKILAAVLATHLQDRLLPGASGAALVGCAGEGQVVAAVFGNERYATTTPSADMAELVRQRLGRIGIEVLSDSLSRDGSTWALIVQIEDGRFKTLAGRAFHIEMMRSNLEEAVYDSWHEAQEMAAASDSSTLQGQAMT